jgi:hypothetical protein
MFLTGTVRTEISFVAYILPGPGVQHQIQRSWNLQYVYHPKKIEEKVGPVDRQRITADKCFGIYIGI